MGLGRGKKEEEKGIKRETQLFHTVGLVQAALKEQRLVPGDQKFLALMAG